MNYTEFYVVPTSVDATASNLNGGSGGTPHSIVTTIIGNTSATVNGDQTANIALDDFLTFDTLTSKRRCKVTSTPVYAALFTTFSITPTDGGAALGTPAPGLTTIYRGNWADPSMVAGLTTASVNAAGDPPRLNVYEPATYAPAGGVSTGSDFTAAIPLTIEGYSVYPGDLRGTMTGPLIQVNSGNSGAGVVNPRAYTTCRNLEASTTQSGIHAFNFFNKPGVHFFNCTGTAPTNASAFYINYPGGTIVDTCLAAGGNVGYNCIDGNSCNLHAVRATGLGGSNPQGVLCNGIRGMSVTDSVFYNFAGVGVAVQWNSGYSLELNGNTYNTLTYGVSCLSNGELASVSVTNSIFANLTLAVYSAQASQYLARFAHNVVYNCGSPYFGANVLDNSEDIVTGSNPFANGNEIPTGGALSHQELMADGTTYTYPDLGAMQTLSTNPGVGNVKGPPGAVTYYFGGVLYTGTGANISGRGGFIFGD